MSTKTLLAVTTITAVLMACGSTTRNPCSGAGISTCQNPHAAGWENDRSLGPGFHGDAARTGQGPNAHCGECHDQGAQVVCVACHRVGGVVGVNIHTTTFLASHTHGDIAGNGSADVGGGATAPCLACHGT